MMKPLERSSTFGKSTSIDCPSGIWHVTISITDKSELVLSFTVQEVLGSDRQMSEKLIIYHQLLASGPTVSKERNISIEFSKRMSSSVQGNGFSSSKSKLFLVEVDSCASVGMNIWSDFQIRGQEWTICITRWSAIRSSSFELDGTWPGDFTITLLSSKMTTSIT